MPGLLQNITIQIRGLIRIDKLDVYITNIKKNSILSLDVYDGLHTLKKDRNRMHIQNTKSYLPADEGRLFNIALKDKAENCLEIVFKTMHRDHARPDWAHHVDDFKIPWAEKQQV